MKVSIASLAALLALGACALFSSPNPEGRSRPEDVETFVRYVQEDIIAHAWQTLLSSSDPADYRRRVVEGGLEETVYLAELLGLRREGNDIQDGEELEWEDFDRIESASLAVAEDGGSRVTGTVTLATGETLQVEFEVRQIRDRFVLAGTESTSS